MDQLPDLLSEAVGDSAVIDTIDVGGGDTVVVTTETTYLYRSEGLLKDESVESFDHNVERFSVRAKRRKSSIRLETIDTEASFTVPSDIADQVIEAMMRGILLTNGTVDPEEEIAALFRFSELTVVVTDRRLFEHVGGAVWDGDFETVAYGDLSGLDFERGSVATQVVLETRERRRRVKVPNEHAGTVRRVVQDAVFGFHGVESIEALRAEIAPPEGDEPTGTPSQASSGNEREASDSNGARAASRPNDRKELASTDWSAAADSDRTGSSTQDEFDHAASEGNTRSPDHSADRDSAVAQREAGIAALTERVEALDERIDRQTELIEGQQELIEQLVDELRRGR